MKILGRLFDLIFGLIYSFLLTTVLIDRNDLLDKWEWWAGSTVCIGISFTMCKWNKDEIDSLKEEIKNLKEYNNEKTL